MDVGSTELNILQVTQLNRTSIKVIRNYIY